MQMHNPPHPGTFIEGVYLEPRALSIHRAATGGWQKPRVAPGMTQIIGRRAMIWKIGTNSFWISIENSPQMIVPAVAELASLLLLEAP
jgi:hypothetical protein